MALLGAQRFDAPFGLQWELMYSMKLIRSSLKFEVLSSIDHLSNSVMISNMFSTTSSSESSVSAHEGKSVKRRKRRRSVITANHCKGRRKKSAVPSEDELPPRQAKVAAASIIAHSNSSVNDEESVDEEDNSIALESFNVEDSMSLVGDAATNDPIVAADSIIAHSSVNDDDAEDSTMSLVGDAATDEDQSTSIEDNDSVTSNAQVVESTGTEFTLETTTAAEDTPVVAMYPAREVDKRLTQAEQRQFISLFYRTLGAPPPAEWDGKNGTVSKIVSAAKYTKGQREKVKNVIQKTYQSICAGKRYDPFERKPCKGRPAIVDGSKVQQLIADFLEIGLSLTGATDLINQILHQAGLPTVSRSAVHSCALRMTRKKRPIRKRPQGSKDPKSTWSKVRYRMGVQYDLRQGKDVDITEFLNEDGTVPDCFNKEILREKFPLDIYGIAFFDVSK